MKHSKLLSVSYAMMQGFILVPVLWESSIQRLKMKSVDETKAG